MPSHHRPALAARFFLLVSFLACLRLERACVLHLNRAFALIISFVLLRTEIISPNDCDYAKSRWQNQLAHPFTSASSVNLSLECTLSSFIFLPSSWSTKSSFPSGFASSFSSPCPCSSSSASSSASAP